jgi:hypothetical protein
MMLRRTLAGLVLAGLVLTTTGCGGSRCCLRSSATPTVVGSAPCCPTPCGPGYAPGAPPAGVQSFSAPAVTLPNGHVR